MPRNKRLCLLLIYIAWQSDIEIIFIYGRKRMVAMSPLADKWRHMKFSSSRHRMRSNRAHTLAECATRCVSCLSSSSVYQARKMGVFNCHNALHHRRRHFQLVNIPMVFWRAQFSVSRQAFIGGLRHLSLTASLKASSLSNAYRRNIVSQLRCPSYQNFQIIKMDGHLVFYYQCRPK